MPLLVLPRESMKGSGGPNHAFVATRKGTPLGEPCPALRYCDDCGETLEAPQHTVSDADGYAALVGVLEGKGD